MSRKTARNASKNESKKNDRLVSLDRTTKIGLSGLALGSLTLAASGGLAHAQNAPAASDNTQPKGTADAPQAGTRVRGHRAQPMASTGSLPADGAGLVAQASAADQSAAGAPPASTLQEIVVTGIRGSLERSLQIKKESIGVVDAISAESIGNFPDASLGEALQRVPGITVNRGAVAGTGGAPLSTGNASSITIRGFGGDFVETLVDGREQASAASNSRQFDYASMGADFVGQVDVHKTPDFALSGGDIGGTVNIKLPTPFDNPGFHASGLFSEGDSTNDGQFAPEFGGLVSDTFADNTIGVLISGEYDDQKTDEHDLSNAGWQGTYLNSCQMAGGPTCVGANGAPLNYTQVYNDLNNSTTPKNTQPSWFIQDYGLYNDRTDERRKTGRVVLQWHPNDALMVTLNDNYSDDRLESYRSEFSVWFNSGSLYNVQTDANGTITSFDYQAEPTDFDADVDGSYIKNNEIGANVVWYSGDDWTTELDMDQSASWLNPGGQVNNFDADVGYGPSGKGAEAAGYPNAWSGTGVVVQGGNNIPYLATWGPNDNQANVLGLNPLILGSHVFPITYLFNDDYVNEAQLGETWHAGSTKVHFGAQYTDDHLHTWSYDDFYNNAWQLFSGYGSPSANTGGVALPASLFSGGIPTGNFFPGWNNNNLQPQSLLEYSPWAIAAYLTSLPLTTPGVNPGAISSAHPQYTGGFIPVQLDPNSIGEVREKTYAPYVTISHAFDLGATSLNSELGLRYERTEETTNAVFSPLTSLTISTSDHTNEVANYGTQAPQTTENKYGYLLPSLDLNLMLTNDLKLRFDASRTMTRPPLSYITPSQSITGTRVGSLTAKTNNPYLLPYLSNNFDLGAEWYYSSGSYLAVDGYFKHVSQFPELTTTHSSFPGVIDPATGSTAVFTTTEYLNGPTANVDGVEITWQQMLPLGFGYMLNGNIMHSNASFNPNIYTNQFALPGVGNSVNAVAFYQQHGFQARVAVNWQASQFLAFGQQQNNSATGTEPTFLNSSTEVDFSSSYEITQNVTAFFEALNLTDAQYVTHGRWDNQILDVIDYGRSFTLGVRAKF
jgi:iron complex outermembrane receptor protein